VRLALLALLVPCAAGAASFDCAKASTRIEKAICADAELSTLDEHLGRFYFGARERLAENGSCVVADQREWIRRRRNACADGACLKKSYLERLAELVALQPGMNLTRNLELPRAPALVWAIATPEEMKGDPRVPSKPFRAEGKLQRGDNGISVGNYVLIGDMFLGGATATQLPIILETGRTARFAARGFLREDSTFDNQHCVYLYRLP
jgi:uncharacterized protein